MGASGTAVFSDDVAVDVRDEWRQCIAEGMSADEATDKVLTTFAPLLADVEDRNVVWLALAVAQWKTGRLLDSVRERAIAVIETGDDLMRWENAKDRRARERVLAKTREMLESPQPEPTRIRRPWISTTPYEVGDVVQVDATEGERVLLLVVAHLEERSGGRAPIFAPLHWLGTVDDHAPDPATLDRAKPEFCIGRLNKKDDADPERVRVIGRLPVDDARPHGYEWTWWRDVDKYVMSRLLPRLTA